MLHWTMASQKHPYLLDHGITKNIHVHLDVTQQPLLVHVDYGITKNLHSVNTCINESKHCLSLMM
jgi:hypothetical protein